jgi:hypothetical protein
VVTLSFTAGTSPTVYPPANAPARRANLQETASTSLGSALFWTSTQLLTVSSSIQNPISTPARLLDVAMEVYAITVVASLAGAMGAFMVKRGAELEHAAGRAKDAAEHPRVHGTTGG